MTGTLGGLLSSGPVGTLTGSLTSPAGGTGGTVTAPAGSGTVSTGLSGSSNGGTAGTTNNLLAPVTNLLGGLLGGGTKK